MARTGGMKWAVGTYGASRIYFGSIPKNNCVMVVFPATTMWEMRERSMPLILTSSSMMPLMVPTTVSCIFSRPPGFAA